MGPKVENIKAQIHPKSQSTFKHTCGQQDWLPCRLQRHRYLICIYLSIDTIWNNKLESEVEHVKTYYFLYFLLLLLLSSVSYDTDKSVFCICKAHTVLGKAFPTKIFTRLFLYFIIILLSYLPTQRVYTSATLISHQFLEQKQNQQCRANRKKWHIFSANI